MNRLSFWTAHLAAIAMLLVALAAAAGIAVAVLLGLTSPWLLLLTILFGWYGLTAINGLRSWFRRMPGERIELDARGFRLDGLLLPFDQVAEIRCRTIITDKRLNLANAGRDFTVLASIVARDGRVHRLRGGQGPVTWFGPTYGAQSCRSLMDKLRIGHEQTSASWIAE